jgi:hypothetical protein
MLPPFFPWKMTGI